MKKTSVSLMAILLCGCSTTGMFNTYLDFSEIDADQIGQCADVFFANGDHDEFHEELKKAITYACGVRGTYREAMGNRSTLRRTSTLPVLGLGAIGVGLGLSGYDTTTILATSLTGATIAGGSRLYDTRSDERAYVLGTEAVTCALQAVTPLVAPANVQEMAAFDDILSKDDGIEFSLVALKTEMVAAESLVRGGSADQKDNAILQNQIATAKELVGLTETTVRNARALRAQRVQVPAMLTVAVDRIIGQVDSSIQSNALSIDSTVSVISSLASSYQSFTAVPEAPAKPTVTPTTGGDTPAPETPTQPPVDIQAQQALIRGLASTTADVSNTRVNFDATGSIDDEALRSLSSSLATIADVQTNLQTKINEVEAEQDQISRFDTNLFNLQNLVTSGNDPQNIELPPELQDFVRDNNDVIPSIRSTQDEVLQQISELKETIDNQVETIGEQKEKLGESEQARKALEVQVNTLQRTLQGQNIMLLQAIARSSKAIEAYEAIKASQENSESAIDVQSSALNDAIASVDQQRRLLADVVNSVVSLKPTETLKACGVDTDNIIGPLTVTPGRLDFQTGQPGSQFVIINGGQPPYSASLASSDGGVTIDKADPFAASFAVKSDGSGNGRSDILIVDGGNRRLVLPVSVSEPLVAPPPKKDETVTLPEEGLNDRATASANNIAALNSGVEDLQTLVCITGDNVDGNWGPVSQKQYELNRITYGIPGDDDGIVKEATIGTIYAKLESLGATSGDITCNDGRVTLPPAPAG